MISNNITGSKNSYTSPITSKHQNSDKDTEKSKKSKQTISEREGNYYATYIVDEEGQKVLINKVPVTQMEKQKSSQNTITSNKEVKNNSSTPEYNQKMHIEAVHRKNIREVMDILKGTTPINNTPKKLFNY
ncbi:hypothetical protein HBE96_22835 [Clostridium sp. P21]|uniref:Uncharacterized protein n=1 Tax=Clostridium muellerianum TaxID=2716538 RepID=A0A7Y0HRP3_9CLOT|nr:hypothetical protein [Clostridium muellerianum]NMM65416.1 hypothetical protein [Clostridium muellerianum]